MKRVVLGINIIKDMKQEVAKIRKNLEIYQDRKKGYENKIECIGNSMLGIMFSLE